MRLQVMKADPILLQGFNVSVAVLSIPGLKNRSIVQGPPIGLSHWMQPSGGLGDLTGRSPWASPAKQPAGGYCRYRVGPASHHDARSAAPCGAIPAFHWMA